MENKKTITVYAVLYDEERGDEALKLITSSMAAVDEWFEDCNVTPYARENYWTIEEWEVEL